MNKNILCGIIFLTSSLTALSAQAANPYIGHWALTLPNGGPGWLGVTQENGDLDAAIVWGGGSVKAVNSVKVQGDRLVVTRVEVARRGADKGKKIIDNKAILGCTGGALRSDPMRPGPLYLQGNHGAASFRNIVLTKIIKK